MAKHNEITGIQAIHQSAFVGSTDPALDANNNVLANKFWIDTANGGMILKLRNAANNAWLTFKGAFQLEVVLSDEATAITTGVKLVTRARGAFYLTEVRASLTVVSSSGLPTIDIKKNGTTVLSTLLTIDASEKTSVTAATPAVISVPSFADDDEITFEVTNAGTGAKGLKVWLNGKAL